MRVKRTGVVAMADIASHAGVLGAGTRDEPLRTSAWEAMADTLSSHLIIRDCNHSVVPSFVSVRQPWFLVVKRPQFGSVLQGTTLRDSQLCLRF